MSYSICNVLSESGLSNIKRWLPFEIDDKILTNRISNKMIRPTTIPQTIDDLKINNVQSINLYSLMKKINYEEFYFNNAHLNEKGHDYLAKIIYGYIK